MRIALALFVWMAAFAGPALAQSPAPSAAALPEYDGVYYFDDQSSDWVELRPARFVPVGIFRSASDRNARFPTIGVTNDMLLTYGIAAGDFAAAPILPNSLRLLVRNPDFQFGFVNILVPLEALAGSVGQAPSPRNRASSPDIAGQLRAIPGNIIPDFVTAANGWGNQNARVRTIDHFTQELNFGHLAVGSARVPPINERCRSVCILRGVGVAIELYPRSGLRMTTARTNFAPASIYYVFRDPEAIVGH